MKPWVNKILVPLLGIAGTLGVFTCGVGAGKLIWYNQLDTTQSFTSIALAVIINGILGVVFITILCLWLRRKVGEKK